MILTDDDARVMLRQAMAQEGGLRAWARNHDIPNSRASEFETGRRAASLPILVALGLTRAIVPLAAMRSGETPLPDAKGWQPIETTPEIPDGYALVPIVPTRAMWAAGGNAVVGYKQRHHDKVVAEIWQGMLAAAPPLPDAPAAEHGGTIDH